MADYNSVSNELGYLQQLERWRASLDLQPLSRMALCQNIEAAGIVLPKECVPLLAVRAGTTSSDRASRGEVAGLGM